MLRFFLLASWIDAIDSSHREGSSPDWMGCVHMRLDTRIDDAFRASTSWAEFQTKYRAFQNQTEIMDVKQGPKKGERSAGWRFSFSLVFLL
jgi:hypothetical protein